MGQRVTAAVVPAGQPPTMDDLRTCGLANSSEVRVGQVGTSLACVQIGVRAGG